MTFQKPFDKQEDTAQRFERLYHRYHKRMILIAYVILGDSFEAQDVANEAFVTLSNEFDRICEWDDTSIGSYMLDLARNNAFTLLNKKKNQKEVTIYLSDYLSEEMDEETAFHRFWETRDIQHHVDQVIEAIEHIHPSYRDVLKLHYLEELSVEEIAKRLDRKPDTVKHQLARGTNLLARNIQMKEGTYDKEKEPQVRRHRYSKKERPKK